MSTVPVIVPGETATKDHQPQVSYKYNVAGFKTGEVSANENAKETKQETNYVYDPLGNWAKADEVKVKMNLSQYLK
jgi:hypothetical protein